MNLQQTGGGSGAVTSVAGRTGAVVLAEGDITNLTTDLAAKAPLASPALTGTPTAPTAAAATNTTQLATTAFVESEIPLRSAVLSVASKTGVVTLVEGDIANLTTDLAAKEVTANKDVANGYAGIDANKMLKPAEFSMTRNKQTGTTYTVVDGDRGKLVYFTNAAQCVVALPQAGAASSFLDGWYAEFLNLTGAALIINITTSTVYGVLKIIAPPGSSFMLTSDGTNYVISGMDTSGLAAGMGGFAGGAGEVYQQNASGPVAWNGATLGAGALGTNAVMMILLTAQLCGHCSLTNSGVVASSKVFTGLYDNAGNLLIDVAGATGFDGSIATLQTKAFTQVLLLPGVYYYVFGIGTSGSNTNTSSTGFTNTAVPNAQLNSLGKRYVKCANAWSGSTGLPATLGALTTIAAANIPCAFFEP